MAIPACVLSSLLTACGGGGSDAVSAPVTQAVSAPAESQVVTPVQATVDTAQLNLGSTEQRVLTAAATPIAVLDAAVVPAVVPAVVTAVAPTVVASQPDVTAPVADPVVAVVTPPATDAATPTIGHVQLAVLDWLTSPQSFATLPPKAVSDPFRSEDLKVSVAATHLYPISTLGLQCQGTNDTLFKVPAVRMAVGKTLADSLQRFGQTANVSGVQALRFAVDQRDELPTDWPPRCELLAYPTAASSLPVGEPFWFAVSLWLDDLAGTQDEQIVSQWHQNDPRLNLNPFMALVQKGNTLRIELRQSAESLATKSGTSLVVPATLTVKPRQWVQIVIKAQIAQQAGAEHYFQLWQDGIRVVNYTGPLGYSLASGSYAYAKVGMYKWLNGNPWDTTVPTRQVMLRSMLIARDPLNRYTADGLASALTAQ